jgi:hypothetical protein
LNSQAPLSVVVIAWGTGTKLSHYDPVNPRPQRRWFHASSGQILFPQVQVAGCARPSHRGRGGVFLALIHLKAVVGYPHGFQDLHWESGFFLGEASLWGRFLHFFRAVVLGLGDSIQAHLSSGVDPTAAAWADEIRSFLTTEHTI